LKSRLAVAIVAFMLDWHGRRTRTVIGLAAMAVLLCLVIGWAAGQVPARTGTDDRSGEAPFVLIGVAGLAWPDIRPDQTPRLWQMLTAGAAAGAATVRTTREPACAADGWLSLNAGQPSTGPRWNDGSCEPLPVVWGIGGGRSAQVANWSRLVDAQRGSEFSPRPGRLGSALAEEEGCETAVGPGAAMALADLDGVVSRYRATFDEAVLNCPITIIDGGQVVQSGYGRLNSLARIDRFVGHVLDRLDGNTTVLVQGVSEPPGGIPELAVSMLAGPRASPRPNPAFLTVSSTRWDGVVRLLDVPSTLLDVAGASAPTEFGGAPLSVGGARPADATVTVHRLGDITVTDRTLRRWSGILLLTVGLGQTLLFVAALVARSRLRPAAIGRWRRWFTAALLSLAVLPVAVYLVTLIYWWRAPLPSVALWGGLAATVAAVAVAVGMLPRHPLWRVPLVVSLVTFAVLAVDALTGTPLHRASPFGPSALYGGRYYGFGNSTFAVFSVAALTLAGAAAAELLARGRRGLAVAAVAAIGVTACAIDTYPGWGADVGGGIALMPGVVILTLVVAGWRITLVRLAAAGLAGAALVAVVGLADWSRPPAARTHAGRFVQDIIDGQAWGLVSRKAGYAFASLSGGPLAWITMAVLIVAVLALTRPARFSPSYFNAAIRRWPTLRPTFAAVVATSVIGALVNDYGIRIVTFALISILPLVALSCVRAAELETEPAGGPAPDPAVVQ
jgi:hypothetical protein